MKSKNTGTANGNYWTLYQPHQALSASQLLWWTKTSGTWQYQELISWFVKSCWDITPAAHAAGLMQRYFNKLNTETPAVVWLAA